ncbi:Uma2 family endonuclease [Gordonia sp. (in: high G+C Gram-positive bacteria)]|uniref:Uma2 family endonuclease n=1 Tax=Gordonia sp. (in: high G+C Gram-positive bacteria) TaxID=84139 RepID=UPI00352982B1
MATMTTQVRGLPYGRPLTNADLDSMPDDGHRYELIDGVLIVSPAPRLRHQRVSMRLSVVLFNACPDDIEVLAAPFDVVLAGDSTMQPDLIVTRTEHPTERNLPVAPLLAIEILSRSTRTFDLLLKKDRLARAGCPHYWVVDPDEPSITAWTLRDGEYVVVAEATGDRPFAVTDPFPVAFTPSDLVL